MGKIHFYAREKWGVYSVQKGAIAFIVSQDFFTNFYYSTTRNGKYNWERN